MAKVAYYMALVMIGLGLLVYFGGNHIAEYVKGNMIWKYYEKMIARPSLGLSAIFPSTEKPVGGVKPDVEKKELPRIHVESNPSTPEPPGKVSSRPAPLSSPEPEARSVRIVKLEKGKTIFSLCQEYYSIVNTTLADFILESNPEIKDVHRIMAYGKIGIPVIEESSLIAEDGEGTYGIYLGTFFSADFASAYKNEPSLRGKEIKLVPKRVSPQETWYRIIAEKFASREESLQVIQALKKRGLLPAFGGKLGSS